MSRAVFWLMLTALLPGAATAQTATQTPNPTQRLHAMVYHAAKTNNVELLEAFVAHRGDPNFAHTDKRYTPLMVAAYYGHARSIDLLLKGGADACARDARGNTALMGAIFKGHFDISKRLMGHDCAVKGRNAAQQTPLMFAALFGRSKTVAALVARGARIDARDASGQSAVDLAQGQHNTQMLALLTQLADR